MPDVSTSRVLPPLIAQHISSNEVIAARDTMKNVYAPYMRNLLIGPRSFSWPPSDASAQDISKIELLTPDRDITDFTLQAVLNNNFMTEGRLAYGPIGFHARGGIIFRLNSQAGEGYILSLASRHNWDLSIIRTHSRLSSELLPTPDIIEWKEGVLPSKHPSLRQVLESFLHPSMMIAIVAQGETIDFYVNLLHVTRVENASILEGKIGFHLFSLQKQHQNTYSSSYGYGTPNAAIESLKLWVP